MPSNAHVVAVEWNRHAFHAWLATPDGSILRELHSQDGLRLAQREQFAMTFNALCGPWLATLPDARVVIAGEAGDRRGWVPTPILPCPADPAAINAACRRVRLVTGQDALVLPGFSSEDSEGGSAVSRSCEIAALGAGIADGVVCIPGAVSFWAELRGGAISRFATYLTGEFEQFLRGHPDFASPAAPEDDRVGFALGLATAARGAERMRETAAQRAILPLGGVERGGGTGGRSLLRLLQDVRATMALERMNERQLGSCLAGLLIGDEVRDALAAFGSGQRIHLLADRQPAWRYGEALADRGADVVTLAPATCFVRGAAAIANAAMPARAVDEERMDLPPVVPRFVFETPFRL